VRTRVHPTAILDDGVDIGPGTSVWDYVHIRGPTRVGAECIIGEKTYIAYGVDIGDRVKINAFVYICSGVTVEDGAMISAGTVFTNDRLPRATVVDLSALRPSDPNQDTLPTLVREGATIGARSVVGCDLVIGRWSMVGMGSVVTRSVSDFHLVVGQPARSVACVCRCGEPFLHFDSNAPTNTDVVACPACGLRYAVRDGEVLELTPPLQSVTSSAQQRVNR
jgi:UDP-2-acetamido-3-amino-2,3-dideoxy-glucuronate N-acetyltransferase